MFLFLLLLFGGYGGVLGQKCTQITIPMCKGIGYNFTRMPNSFNHDSQEEAGLEVHQYWPLVEIKCSSDLRFFICSLYVPICMEDYEGGVTACRSVCLRARAGCEPVMTQYGFLWPEKFSCTNFPQFGPRSICMDERRGELPSMATNNINNKTSPVKKNTIVAKDNCINNNCCKKPLVKKKNGNCTLPCQLYPTEREEFGGKFIWFWGVVCFTVSFVTLATFLIDRGGRFRFPERPIVWLSFCYLFISAGYVAPHYFSNPGISCDNDAIIKENVGLGDPCFITFFFVYFFGVASGAWWVNLSISWYLASGLKWSSEAIAKKSIFFHLVAWLPSAVLTFLVRGDVDGDPVAGICLIGNGLNKSSILQNYLILPMATCLLIGSLFLIGGFVELFKIRNVITKQAIKTEKLEKLMIRIGVFSILYFLPASAVIATQLYEINSREKWINNSSHGDHKRPLYSLLMIKYFMSLAVGISSGGVWIMSTKTCGSWWAFFTCQQIRGNSGGDKIMTTTGQHHNVNRINNKLAHV